MYIILLRKNKSDKTPFAITETVKNYLLANRKDIIYSFPGFICKTPTTIKKFCTNVLVSNRTKNFYVIFPGMIKLTTQIQNQYKKYLYKRVHINNGSYKVCDHSKVMIFFENANNLDFDSINLIFSLGEFYIIDEFKPKAMLIGSSNQSYQTYLGKNSIADKGETDILILDDCFGDAFVKRFVKKLNENNTFKVSSFKQFATTNNLSQIVNEFLKSLKI